MKKFLTSTVLGLLATCILLFAAPGTTQASQIFLRGQHYGFFYNSYDAFGSDLIAGGMNCFDINCFVGFYWGHLFSADPARFTPAGFTVLDMLGAAPGGSPLDARGRFAEWESAVRWYDANGRIAWNIPYFYTTNTFKQFNQDVAWYGNVDTRLSTVFYNPDGVTSYAIKRDCANPVGDARALTVPPPPTVVSCGAFSVSNNEPIQNYSNITVTGRVTYSGGPAGAPTVSNTGMWISPQFPGGIGHSAGVSGSTVYVTSGGFVPNAAGTYNVTWQIQVNETVRQCAGSFVVYPPTVLTCGTADSIPVQPEVNTPIRIRATGGWTGGPPTITSGNLSINVAPTPGNVPLQSSTVSGGNVDMTSQLFTPVTAGIYTITWTFRVNEAAVITCSDTFPVLNHPFFDVNGGDVLAGTAFSTTAGSACAASPAPHNPDAGVVGWNNRTSPAFAGTGIDYAAFALNYVQDAATSRANTAANAQALSFANVPIGAPASVTPASGLFGGMFGSISTCVDYWGAKLPDSSLTPWTAGNVNGTATGKYVHNGNLVLGGGNIGNDRRITLYVNGDVYIPSNISYNGSNGWSRPEQIPSFTLVVYGRIFISESVSQLDGVYVAVPDNINYADPAKARDSVSSPRRGTILTCAPAGFTGHTLLAIANNPGLCDGNGTPLRVNGSLIGAQLFLLRTLGSVTTGQPAEIFNYSPEVWMAPSSSSPVGTVYDSVVGLPPVL